MAIEPLPRDRDTLHPLAGSLERLQRSLGLARPDTLALLTESWPQLVGSRLAAACRLHSLRDGCLTVAVDDPAVAEHLRWQSSDLAAAARLWVRVVERRDPGGPLAEPWFGGPRVGPGAGGCDPRVPLKVRSRPSSPFSHVVTASG